MKIALISTQSRTEKELETVIHLFDHGLDYYHLKKPKFSRKKLETYIKSIPQNYRSKVILHNHHSLAVKYKLKGIHIGKTDRRKQLITKLKVFFFKIFHKNLVVTTSYHSLQSLLLETRKFHYVFLSPIFESISKKNYSPAFNERQLISANEKSINKVFALGGVDEQHIDYAKKVGFYGIVLFGSIWNSGKNKIETFVTIKKSAARLKNQMNENLGAEPKT